MCWKNIVELAVLLTAIDRLDTLYQNSNDIFHRNKKNNTKIHMEPQTTLNTQKIFEKKAKLEASLPLI